MPPIEFAAASSAEPSWDLSHGPLQVHRNGRFLQHADGTPFWFLGDTAWEIFHRLSREEVELYLDRRSRQGFTVIKGVALAEFEGATTPNAYGHLALIDKDPARPDVRSEGQPDYWKHVDFVVEAARQRGIYVALLPTWADKIGPAAWGKGPEIFTETNAHAFGRFLGERYRRTVNLIWVLGGDRPLIWEGKDHRPLWRAMVAGIKEGEAGGVPHLMSFHPVGGQSSSPFMHDEPWLDFNMLQSGHGRRDDANYAIISTDYSLSPPKPTFDGEPRYEDHPIDFKAENGWFDAVDVRHAAYWALFAGAFGHTYGAHGVWQFFAEGRIPVSRARTSWQDSLDLEGAWDMQHLRALLLSRPFLSRIPDPSIIASGQGLHGDHVEATRDQEGSYLFVYIPSGKKVTVHLGRLATVKEARAWWFDPRTGQVHPAGDYRIERDSVRREFQPPGEPGRGNDWVLVVDDATKGFPPPGQKR